MNVKNQKVMASKILKCGMEKVWIDPEEMEDISKAITKADVRKLINRGMIKKKNTNNQSRGRARKILEQKKLGRRKNRGSRKGKKMSKTTGKKEWIKIIRPMRRTLKELRDSESITSNQYRRLYLMAKGGRFKSRNHMKLFMEKEGMIKEK